ncbi:MAG: retron system putative HNH endonuclease [Bacteroidota bacterium]
MRYIPKKENNEPSSLRAYRETTPKANYEGFSDARQLLKKALLEEQGHLCAYCMKRISLKRNRALKPRIEVEHFRTQSSNPELDLDYKNMLGVCNGYTFKSEHCDKSKKDKNLQVLNPLEKTVEAQITFSLNGYLSSKKNNTKVEEDIELLNLNDQNIVEARKKVIDLARTFLIRKKPIGQWTKVIIQKEIDEWKSKNKAGKFREYCQVAIWFWEQQLKKSRYPAK